MTNETSVWFMHTCPDDHIPSRRLLLYVTNSGFKENLRKIKGSDVHNMLLVMELE